MNGILYLLSFFISLGIKIPFNAFALGLKGNKCLWQVDWISYVDDTKPTESLDEILKKDINSEGIINNILGGLALCYNALANILLYPVFSFLLVVLSLGIVILATFLIKKIKEEQELSPTWMICSVVYLLVYLDLFLVVFQKNTILFLFLELEKDLIMFIIAALLGYIIGKYFSSRSFEEKRLP